MGMKQIIANLHAQANLKTLAEQACEENFYHGDLYEHGYKDGCIDTARELLDMFREEGSIEVDL